MILKFLREKRGLTLREVGTLSGLDHAYINRLETGVKEAPSEGTLSKLAKALRASPREAEIMTYVERHSGTDPGLIKYSLTDESVTLPEIIMASGVVYRGPVRKSYAELIKRMRKVLEQEEPNE